MPTSPAGPITLNPTADDSVIQASTLIQALSLASVTVTTGSTGSQSGDITVATNLSWSGNNSLTLSAYRNVVIDDGVTIANSGAGNLNLRADATGTGVGTVSFNGTGKVDFSGSTGTVSIYYNPSDNPAGSVVNATSYTTPTDYSSSVVTNSAVPGQLTAYMLVNTVYDLQNIENNFNGNYAVGKDIDARETSTWNSGNGFKPLGENINAGVFRGTLDGGGHTISGLTINSQDGPDPDVGLFGIIGQGGVVRNLGLINVNITLNEQPVTGWGTGGDVGGIVAYNSGGTISNSYVTGSVSATGVGQTGSAIVFIGGIAGINNFPNDGLSVSGGTIKNSYSMAAVSTDLTMTGVQEGGLAGVNNGTIASSFSAGAVTVTYNNSTTTIPGGLIGYAGGTTTSSYWDTRASTQTTSSAGVGLTTSELKSGLPSGFDPVVWAISSSVNNGYPYLIANPPTGTSPAVSPVVVNFSSGTNTDSTIATLDVELAQLQQEILSIELQGDISQQNGPKSQLYNGNISQLFTIYNQSQSTSIVIPGQNPLIFSSMAAQAPEYSAMQLDIKDSEGSIINDIAELAVISSYGGAAELADKASTVKGVLDDISLIENGKGLKASKDASIQAMEVGALGASGLGNVPGAGQVLDIGTQAAIILGSAATESEVNLELAAGNALGGALYNSGIYGKLTNFFGGGN